MSKLKTNRRVDSFGRYYDRSNNKPFCKIGKTCVVDEVQMMLHKILKAE